MDPIEIQAARDLIAFARDHAEEVFGDDTVEARANTSAEFEAADSLEQYLDGDGVDVVCDQTGRHTHCAFDHEHGAECIFHD